MVTNQRVIKTIFLLLMAMSCQSFGQLKPNLAFEGKVIHFDEKFTKALDSRQRAEVLKSVNDVIDSALAQKIVNIGELNLLQLKEQIQQVNLVLVGGGATALGSGQFTLRMGNVNVPSTRTIYINESTQVMNQEGSMKLMPHEFLEALGYQDKKYQISAIMLSKNAKLFADTINARRSDLGKKSLRPEIKNMMNRSSSGGVTIIGGGGDDLLFAAKLYMLDHYQEWQNWFRNHYLKESDYYDLALKKGVDLRGHLDDKIFDDYLAYFAATGIEHMPEYLRKTNAPLENPDDLSDITNIYDEDGEIFIRLSRDHWNYPIGHYTIEQSHMMMSAALHTTLFGHFLLERFHK